MKSVEFEENMIIGLFGKLFKSNVIEEVKENIGLQLKQFAGFGKDGYKNFDGIITDLQMQTYLCIKEFRRKRNRKGQEYGMPVCVYYRPEDLWGCYSDRGI